MHVYHHSYLFSDMGRIPLAAPRAMDILCLNSSLVGGSFLLSVKTNEENIYLPL